MYLIGIFCLYFQSQVDQSDTFVAVLAKVEDWFLERGLGQEKSFAVLTDG